MFYRLPRFCQNGFVRVIQLKVADLYAFEGRTPDSNPEPDAIAALARKQFSFLPQPLTVLVEGDNVSLSFPKESAAAEAEAVRLAKRHGLTLELQVDDRLADAAARKLV